MTGGTIFGYVVIGIAVLTLAAWWLWMMGGEAPSNEKPAADSAGGMPRNMGQRASALKTTHDQIRLVRTQDKPFST